MLQKLIPVLLVICCIISFSVEQTIALEEWVPIDNEGPPCGHAGAITTKWDNPHPTSEIISIDAVSLELGAVPIILAISLGDGSLDVHPTEKMTLTWGSLKKSF